MFRETFLIAAPQIGMDRAPLPQAFLVSELLTMVTPPRRDDAGAAMPGGTGSPRGSGRAISRLAALAGFAPRPLVLDLADQFSTDLGEGMIKVALVRSGHQVRASR